MSLIHRLRSLFAAGKPAGAKLVSSSVLHDHMGTRLVGQLWELPCGRQVRIVRKFTLPS